MEFNRAGNDGGSINYESIQSLWKFNGDYSDTLGLSEGNPQAGFDSTTFSTDAPANLGASVNGSVFHGTGQRVDLENVNFADPSNFSLSVWYKMSATPSSRHTVFSKSNASGWNSGSLGCEVFFFNPDIRLRTSMNSGGVSFFGVQALTINTWYLLTYTFDGANFTTYINGVQDQTVAYATPLNNLHDERAGFMSKNQSSYARAFGYMTQGIMWQEALSVSSILELYNSGAGLQYPERRWGGRGSIPQNVSTSYTTTDLDIDGTKPKTICFWISSGNVNQQTKVLEFYDDGPAGGRISILLYTGTLQTIRTEVQGNAYSIEVPSSGTDGWIHYAWTYESNVAYAFANGIPPSNPSNNFALNTLATSPLTLMTNNVTASDANCRMADLRIYNRRLDAQEVLTIYNSQGQDGIAAGLQGRWLERTLGSEAATLPRAVFIASPWQTSLTHATPSVDDPTALILCVGIIAVRSAATIVNSVTYGGQNLTEAAVANGVASGFHVNVFLYYLDAVGIAAAGSSTIVVNYAINPFGSCEYSAFYGNMDQTVYSMESGTSGGVQNIDYTTYNIRTGQVGVIIQGMSNGPNNPTDFTSSGTELFTRRLQETSVPSGIVMACTVFDVQGSTLTSGVQTITHDNGTGVRSNAGVLVVFGGAQEVLDVGPVNRPLPLSAFPRAALMLQT